MSRRLTVFGRSSILVAILLVALPSFAAASGSGSQEHAAGPFGMSPTAVSILKLVNLLLFVGLLVWFAGRPIGAALRKRREKIAAELAEAAKKREEAARTEEEIRRKISALEAEIAEFARKAREEGERERTELIARGEAEAEKALLHAKEEVAAEVLAARRELAAFAGELAVEIAAKSVEAKMGVGEKKEFLDRAITDIGKMETGR